MGGRRERRPSSLFWKGEGFSTVGMALALLISLSLIFTCARVYEINTASSQVQDVADAACLAAENVVGEFYIVVSVCDAVVFTLSLAALVSAALGVVCACAPPAAGFAKGFFDAARSLKQARDSFASSAQESLEKLARALPVLAAARAQEVLDANSGGADGSSYEGFALLVPWEMENGGLLDFDESDTALEATDASSEDLMEEAAKAEEAASEANLWKDHGFRHDSGSRSEYCMYERAGKLASLSGEDNPFFSSVETWSFSASLARAKAYYESRYRNESPQSDSVDEQANSSLRKRFYAYAVETVGAGYVHETADSFDSSFPRLPKNTEEMKQTKLYTDRCFPATMSGTGQLSIHAWEGCPGMVGSSRVDDRSLSDADRSSAYSVCPRCHLAASSMGKVAAASSSIENGFEYHYNEVAKAAEEYERAYNEFAPLSQEVKSMAGDLFDGLTNGLEEVLSQRIDCSPPGRSGAIALVVDRGTSSTAFPSPLVDSAGVGSLGARAALSAATLVPEESSEGETVLTSFLDGLKEAGAAPVGAHVVLEMWSTLLTVYAQGHDALCSSIDQLLGSVPLASASGLGNWAADELKGLVEACGFDPPDLRARKAVVVNSSHVLEGDSSKWSAKFLEIKRGALSAAGESGFNGALSAVETAALDTVEELGGEFQVGTLVVFDGLIELPITITLPVAVTDGLSASIQEAIDSLRAIVASWTGVRQWR